MQIYSSYVCVHVGTHPKLIALFLSITVLPYKVLPFFCLSQRRSSGDPLFSPWIFILCGMVCGDVCALFGSNLKLSGHYGFRACLAGAPGQLAGEGEREREGVWSEVEATWERTPLKFWTHDVLFLDKTTRYHFCVSLRASMHTRVWQSRDLHPLSFSVLCPTRVAVVGREFQVRQTLAGFFFIRYGKAECTC